jgi:general secretion pathway protein J
MEVLVALVVLGLLLAALTQGNRFGIMAWRHQADAIARRDQIDATDRALRQLLTHISIRDGSEPGKLIFTGELPQAVALATRRADMELAVDKEHRLVLRWTSRPHEVSLMPPQDPVVTVLLGDVDRLDVAYWRDPDRATGDPGGWSDDWATGTQPKLMKLSLIFRAGDRRHWPDIIVAPSSLGPAG